MKKHTSQATNCATLHSNVHYNDISFNFTRYVFVYDEIRIYIFFCVSRIFTFNTLNNWVQKSPDSTRIFESRTTNKHKIPVMRMVLIVSENTTAYNFFFFKKVLLTTQWSKKSVESYRSLTLLSHLR